MERPSTQPAAVLPAYPPGPLDTRFSSDEDEEEPPQDSGDPMLGVGWGNPGEAYQSLIPSAFEPRGVYVGGQAVRAVSFHPEGRSFLIGTNAKVDPF